MVKPAVRTLNFTVVLYVLRECQAQMKTNHLGQNQKGLSEVLPRVAIGFLWLTHMRAPDPLETSSVPYES